MRCVSSSLGEVAPPELSPRSGRGPSLEVLPRWAADGKQPGLTHPPRLRHQQTMRTQRRSAPAPDADPRRPQSSARASVPHQRTCPKVPLRLQGGTGQLPPFPSPFGRPLQNSRETLCPPTALSDSAGVTNVTATAGLWEVARFPPRTELRHLPAL